MRWLFRLCAVESSWFLSELNTSTLEPTTNQNIELIPKPTIIKARFFISIMIALLIAYLSNWNDMIGYFASTFAGVGNPYAV